MRKFDIGGMFMTKKPIHKIYGMVLSLCLIVAGTCLMVACVRIYLGHYRTDAGLYSPEAVAAAFRPIAIPVFFTLALLVGNFILHIVLPEESKKASPEKQYGTILANLQKKLDTESCDGNLKMQIQKQQTARQTRKIVCLSLLGVCTLVFLAYGLNRNNFPFEDPTGSVIKAMYLFIPCLAIPFGYSVFTAYANRQSMIQEIALTKEAIAQGGKTTAKTEQLPAKYNHKTVNIAKYAILVIAIVLIISGLCGGGTADVLRKAINLCTECVGLG